MNELYKEELTSPEVDYEFELSKKDDEIKQLKEQIQNNKTSNSSPAKKVPILNPNMKKPFFFEPDIFKAIEKGKLSSVKYHIEHDNINVNLKNSKGETLLMIAQNFHQNEIAQYLTDQGGTLINKRSQIPIDNGSYLIKILFIGDIETKKAEFVNTLFNPREYDKLTLYGNYRIYEMQIGDYNVKLHISDTGGQEKFRKLPKIVFRDIKVIVFTYAIHSYETFTNVQKYIKNAKELNEENIEMILVGIKNTDKTACEVKKEEAENKAKELGISYYPEVILGHYEQTKEFFQHIASSVLGVSL